MKAEHKVEHHHGRAEIAVDDIVIGYEIGVGDIGNEQVCGLLHYYQLYLYYEELGSERKNVANGVFTESKQRWAHGAQLPREENKRADNIYGNRHKRYGKCHIDERWLGELYQQPYHYQRDDVAKHGEGVGEGYALKGGENGRYRVEYHLQDKGEDEDAHRYDEHRAVGGVDVEYLCPVEVRDN